MQITSIVIFSLILVILVVAIMLFKGHLERKDLSSATVGHLDGLGSVFWFSLLVLIMGTLLGTSPWLSQYMSPVWGLTVVSETPTPTIPADSWNDKDRILTLPKLADNSGDKWTVIIPGQESVYAKTITIPAGIKTVQVYLVHRNIVTSPVLVETP